jgi:HEAT repeat protein
MDMKKLFGFNKPDIKKMEREKDLAGLMRLLKFENDETVRRDAAFAIGKISDPNSELYRSYDENNEKPGLEELVTALKDENIAGQKDIVNDLVGIGEPAVEPLINLLKDEKWRVRYYAAEALGEIGDKKAVEPLIDSLNDENNGVRSNSMIALVEIGNPSLNPLINALNSNKWQIRWHAAETLGEIRDKKALKPLIKILNDENPWVRKTGADALGCLGDECAVKPLRTLLDDSDIDVREAAAKAIAKLGQ